MWAGWEEVGWPMEMVFVSLTKAPVLWWWAQPKDLRSSGQGWAQLSLQAWKHHVKHAGKIQPEFFFLQKQIKTCFASSGTQWLLLYWHRAPDVGTLLLSHIFAFGHLALLPLLKLRENHCLHHKALHFPTRCLCLGWLRGFGTILFGPLLGDKPRTGALGAACESSAWLKGFVPRVFLWRRNLSTDPFQEHLMRAPWLERVGEVKNNLWRRHSNEQLSFLSIDFLQQDSPCV